MTSIKNNSVILKCMTAVFLACLPTLAAQAKEIIGWVENVHITSEKIKIKAKIDTGAYSASLHCDYQAPYDRGGEKWIKFSVTDTSGRSYLLDKKIERIVKVKQHFGDVQRRYLVRMSVCLGKHDEQADVSLIDRGGLNYSMLIGRKYLKGVYIVDPSLRLTTRPRCK
ncbi:MAG: RimK/LysX family protein [Gammaproteobacteria bacterium]|nr:RimK/LysX family protein [Gammaproteobacteria bacterium]